MGKPLTVTPTTTLETTNLVLLVTPVQAGSVMELPKVIAKRGVSSSGMTIEGYVNQSGTPATAYPTR